MGPHRASVHLSLLAIALLLTGCGGGSNSSSSPPPSSVSLSVTPLSAVVAQGAQQQFTATVSGSANVAVTWSVQEGNAGGTVTSAGLYTAPNSGGVFHVIVTSQADTSKSLTIAITVPTVFVSINQATVSMGPAETFTFTASVSGTTNHAVTWSVQEGAAGGTVSAGGAYTAPAALGTYHVVATSVQDTSRTATATVTVGTLSVAVSPTTEVLGPAGVRAFTATVTGSVNTAVTWSVVEGAGAGTVSSSGTYTAPNTTGTVHVAATSVKDATKSAVATVTVVASGFRPTASLAAGRSGATATVLPNGKVLVAGGSNCFFSYYYYFCSGDLASAEIYDPATGTFSGTGAMLARRSLHTATLLNNGKVLIAGGSSSSGASAELYDPASGTFSATGSMSVGRRQHTATLLASSGKVLIAGGSAVGPGLTSAELYDATSGTFTATGSMTTARYGHTATTLPNSKVLIVGGFGTSVLGSAELYDPAAGTFAPTGAMATTRATPLAVSLGNGTVLVAGGNSQTGSLASTELYNISTGTFAAGASMSVARGAPLGALLPGGKVLIFSGQSLTAEVFTIAAGTFSPTGSLQLDHQFGALAVLLDGRVLVAGGAGANDVVDTNVAEIYQ